MIIRFITRLRNIYVIATFILDLSIAISRVNKLTFIAMCIRTGMHAYVNSYKILS